MSGASAYEIRLLGKDGAMALLYVTQCLSDEDAVARIARITDVPFARYEIWQDLRKVSDGPRPLGGDGRAGADGHETL